MSERDNPTSFIEVGRNYHEDEWPESYETIVTRIDGDLADKLRRHFRKDGIVLLYQHGSEGGYSECTIEWSWGAWLTIGGEEVQRFDDGEFDEIRFRDVTDGFAGNTTFTRRMTGATRMVRFLIEIGQVG